MGFGQFLITMKSLTLMTAAILLLAFGCSKDEPLPISAPPKPAPGGSSGPGGMSGESGEGAVGGMGAIPQPGSGGALPAGQPAGGTQRVNEDPQAPPVLAEMNGVFYEVYEIAKKPFTGKAVEYHATNVEKSEKVYKDGRLEHFTEWHDNGQKSHEITYAIDGKTTEKRWNKNGEQIGATASGASGREVTWTFGGGQSARRIDGYSGKASALIKRVLGAPDDEQNGVWIYKGMKITAVQSGQIMTVVRFTMANGQVLSVSVEP